MSEDKKAQKITSAANANNAQNQIPSIAPLTEEEKAESIDPKQARAILVQLEASRPLVSEEPDRFDYFIGCTPDSKKFFITVGGHSFPRHTCKVGKDQSGQDTETPIRGGIVKLSDSEAKKLRETIQRKGLRFVGGTSTTFLLENGRRFQDNEFPIAMFLYLYKVTDLIKADPTGWRENMSIPTLMKRDAETTKRFGTGWETPEGESIPILPPHVEDKIERKNFPRST